LQQVACNKLPAVVDGAKLLHTSCCLSEFVSVESSSCISSSKEPKSAATVTLSLFIAKFGEILHYRFHCETEHGLPVSIQLCPYTPPTPTRLNRRDE